MKCTKIFTEQVMVHRDNRVFIHMKEQKIDGCPFIYGNENVKSMLSRALSEVNLLWNR